MKTFAAVLAGLVTAWVASSVHAQPVTLYDNFGTDLHRFLDETNSECGDTITLAAETPRLLNTLSFEYWLKPTVPIADTSVRVRLYYNDGDPLAGQGSVRPPRTLFYDSGVVLLTQSGQASLSLDNLKLEVPDTFTWSVQFSGGSTSQGKVAGVELYSPPTVGSNRHEFWEKNGDTWEQYYWDEFPTDFGARMLSAAPIPEPTTWVLLLIAGAVGVLRFRRGRK